MHNVGRNQAPAIANLFSGRFCKDSTHSEARDTTMDSKDISAADGGIDSICAQGAGSSARPSSMWRLGLRDTSVAWSSARCFEIRKSTRAQASRDIHASARLPPLISRNVAQWRRRPHTYSKGRGPVSLASAQGGATEQPNVSTDRRCALPPSAASALLGAEPDAVDGAGGRRGRPAVA